MYCSAAAGLPQVGSLTSGEEFAALELRMVEGLGSARHWLGWIDVLGHGGLSRRPLVPLSTLLYGEKGY